MGALCSISWTQNTDILVKPVLRHKRHVYVAPAVKPEETSGPTAALLLPYREGGTQQKLSARQYIHQHGRSLFLYPV